MSLSEFVSFSKNPALKKAPPEGKVTAILAKFNPEDVNVVQEIPGSWTFEFRDEKIEKEFVAELANAQVPREMRRGKLIVKTPDMTEQRVEFSSRGTGLRAILRGGRIVEAVSTDFKTGATTDTTSQFRDMSYVQLSELLTSRGWSVWTQESKKERPGTKRAILAEATDVSGALSMLEGKLKKFIAAADDPLSPMEDLTYKIADLVDAYEGGEIVRRGDVASLSSTADAINRSFAKTYSAFAGVREEAYGLAKLIGASTTTSSPRPAPPELKGFSNTEIMADIEKTAHDFKDGYRDLQEAGARVSRLIKAALDAGSSAGADLDAQSQAIVKAFVEFRDSVAAKYYAMLGSVGRRVNELVTRFARKSVIQKEPESKPAQTEDLIKIPWDDDAELGESSAESMTEGWDAVVGKLSQMSGEDAPHRAHDAVEFVSQVLRGGIPQYVAGGLGKHFNSAANYLQLSGGAASDLAGLMSKLSPDPSTASDVKDSESWAALKAWLSDANNLDAVSTAVLGKLGGKAVAEEKDKEDDKEKKAEKAEPEKKAEKKPEAKDDKETKAKKKEDETGGEGEEDEMGVEIAAPIAPNPAPPQGVSTVTPAPGLMKVERLVRKLKSQVMENL